MKIFMLTGLLVLSGVSVSCSREGDGGNIQREEEMNRGDMVEDNYDQSDIHPGNKPSNVGE